MNYEELLILCILVYTYFLSQSRCGTCKDLLNMCTQITLEVNWLQCSGSDREMCRALTSPFLVPPPRREIYPAMPSLPLQDRLVASWERGAVSCWNPTCSTLCSRGSCWGTSSPEQLCQPRSERTNSLRQSAYPRLNDTWSKLSRRVEGNASTLRAIPKCKLFTLCLLSASIQAIQQPRGLKFTLWGDLCLSSKGKCFFSWRRWYYMTYLSSHSYMVQLRLGADLVLVQMKRLKELRSNNWHTQSLCVTVYKDKKQIVSWF